MKSVKAIIRPEKVFEVMEKLSDAGFHAVTRMTILGRGKQRGLKVGNVYYDEIPKELIEIVVEDGEVDKLVRAVPPTPQTRSARCAGSRASFRAAATVLRIRSSSFFLGHRPSTQRLNSSRDPMGRLWAFLTSPARTSRTSALPPPMSNMAPSCKSVAVRAP